MNIPGSVEAITLMHVVKTITEVVHSKEKGRIVVGNDNIKSVKRSISKFNKTLQGAVEGASSIIQIKNLIKLVETTISIEYIRGDTKVKKIENDLLPFLIN